MKIKNFVLVLAFAAFVSNTHAQTIKRVLFVGNSYTGSNDLTNLTRLVAESHGDTFESFDRSPGGFTFANHCSAPDFFDQLRNGNFDAVVLQEQSQLPSFPLDQVESSCFPYAKQIVDSLRVYNPKMRIVFFMTWGRQNGDAQNCATWPPVCSFEGMNELLRQRYIQMAKDNSCRVAPVGSVWRDIKDSTQISLYEPDGSHPSGAGSLLAASVIYATLFDKMVSTGKHAPFVTETENAQIVNTTNSIVKDSSSLWNYEYQLHTEFSKLHPEKSVKNTPVLTPLHNEISIPIGFNTVKIFNAMGAEMSKSNFNMNSNVCQVKVEKLPIGLYFIVTDTGNTQAFWVEY